MKIAAQHLLKAYNVTGLTFTRQPVAAVTDVTVVLAVTVVTVITDAKVAMAVTNLTVPKLW